MMVFDCRYAVSLPSAVANRSASHIRADKHYYELQDKSVRLQECISLHLSTISAVVYAQSADAQSAIALLLVAQVFRAVVVTLAVQTDTLLFHLVFE